MKITKQTLQKIIKEELRAVLKENWKAPVLEDEIKSWLKDPRLANKRQDHIETTIAIRLAHKDDDAPNYEEQNFLWHILGAVESREEYRPEMSDEEVYDEAYDLHEEHLQGEDW